jgi:hypothetical protein
MFFRQKRAQLQAKIKGENMTETIQLNKLNQLLKKAMSDEIFKAQLIETPVAILTATGIKVPEGLEIKVEENTDKVFHLVLPHQTSELNDDDLDAVAGGTIHQGAFPY